MAHTLRLPGELEGATLKAYLVEEGQAVRAAQPIAKLELDGQEQVLSADSEGILLRWLAGSEANFGGGAPIAILGAPGEAIGYDPGVVRAVRILLLRRCDECGSDYPINGLVEQARCTRCGENQRVPPGFWRDYVLEHVNQAKTPRKTSGGGVLAGKHGAATIQCWGVPPLCRKCYSLIEWPAISGAWERAQREGSAPIFCSQCGEPYRARMPPAWSTTVFPGIVFAVGETADGSGSNEPPKPVIFKCPSCLAGLDIDGVKRIVTCRFCDSDVYLPDDLWLHFNPASKRVRWWMLFRP